MLILFLVFDIVIIIIIMPLSDSDHQQPDSIGLNITHKWESLTMLIEMLRDSGFEPWRTLPQGVCAVS